MAAHEVIHTTDYAEKTAGQSMLEVNDLAELMDIVSSLRAGAGRGGAGGGGTDALF